MSETRPSPIRVVDATPTYRKRDGGAYIHLKTDIGVGASALRPDRKSEWTVIHLPVAGEVIFFYPASYSTERMIIELKSVIKLAIVGLLEDIRKETEAEMKAEEQRLDAVINAPFAVRSRKTGRTFIRVNPETQNFDWVMFREEKPTTFPTIEDAQTTVRRFGGDPSEYDIVPLSRVPYADPSGATVS